LEDLGVDERKIVKWIFKKRDGSMEWFRLADDRDRLRAVVNTVMNPGSIHCRDFVDRLRTC
jgi:hypothetical protein